MKRVGAHVSIAGGVEKRPLERHSHWGKGIRTLHPEPAAMALSAAAENIGGRIPTTLRSRWL